MGPLQFPAWDPVLVDLPGPFDLRWYGLMYVVGFVAARYLFRHLAKRRFLPIEVPAVDDLIFYAVIGVVIGGRLGYALFYDNALLNPGRLIQVWLGGMSFHGGLIGVIVAFALFARRQRVPVGRVLDAAALAVTPGIFAVRCANFINGELYGRETTADGAFAMRFPTDPVATHAMRLDLIPSSYKRDVELAIQYAYRKPGYGWDQIRPELHDQTPAGVPIPWDQIKPHLDWAAVREHVPYRYPSQLFEAAGEGILLGVILWLVYLVTRKRPLPPWTYGGVFLLGYGVIRFFLEYFRKPDAQFYADSPNGTVFLGMTMGQTLCSAMILGGGVLVAWGLVRRRRETPA